MSCLTTLLHAKISVRDRRVHEPIRSTGGVTKRWGERINRRNSCSFHGIAGGRSWAGHGTLQYIARKPF